MSPVTLTKSPPSAANGFQEAIQHFLKSLEGEADPLSKVMGFAQADLLQTASKLKHCIDEALTEEDASLEKFDDAAPAMDMHLRYHRLIERHRQFHARQQASREEIAG
jgi:hypothetical protein